MLERIRQLLFLTMLLLTAQGVFAQTGYVWGRSAGGPDYAEFGQDAACDREGNVIFVGEFRDDFTIADSTYDVTGIPGTDNDLFVAKYDPYGNPLWVRVHGSSSLDVLYAVDAGPLNDVYTAGYGKVAYPLKTSDGLHARDALIARYRANGNLAWGRAMDGDVFSEAQDIVGLEDRGCFVTGQYQTQGWFGTDTLVGNGLADAYLVRFDSVGNFVWGRTIGGSQVDKPLGLGADGAENVVVGGYFEGTAYFGNDTLTSSGGHDGFIAKYSSAGTPLWAVALHGPQGDIVNCLKTSPSGNTYFAGSFYDWIAVGNDTVQGWNQDDIFFGKLSPDGQLVWLKSAGGSSYDMAEDLEIDDEENIYIGGWFFGSMNWDSYSTNSTGYDDLFFNKLDSAGNVLMMEFSHFTDTRSAFGLGVDGAQNIFLTGRYIDRIECGPDTLHAVNASGDIYITKFASRNIQLILDSISGSPLCGGDIFTVLFRAYGTFDSANVFYLELSDATGSFASPDTLATIAGPLAGPLTVSVPPGLPYGTGYRMRLVSSAPGITTPDNGYDITLDPSTAIPVEILGDTVFCNGLPLMLQIDQGFVSQLWSTGDTNYFIVVTAPGTYGVEAVDSSGCSNIDMVQVVSCVGTADPRPALHVNCYPNPASGIFEVEGEGAGVWRLDLTDLAGRTVRSREFRAGTMPWRETFRVEDLPRGMYLLRAGLGERVSGRRVVLD